MLNTLYYLHPCATVSAEWLCDADSITQLIEASTVLSSCIRMTAVLPSEGYYAQVYIEHPWCNWTMESAYHAHWVYTYYLSLCHKFKRIYSREHAAQRMQFKLEKLIDIFPMLPFRAPCDDQLMRDAYKDKVRIKDYKHVKRPYFLKQR